MRTRKTATPVHIETLPVFVYGTLRTGQGNWSRLLAGTTSMERPAVAPNHVMWSRGVAFISDGAGQVMGDVMTISPDRYQAVMVELDRLEGIRDRQTGDGYAYCRVQRVVVVDGEEIEVWMYHGSSAAIADLSMQPQYRVPSGDWLTWMAQ